MKCFENHGTQPFLEERLCNALRGSFYYFALKSPSIIELYLVIRIFITVVSDYYHQILEQLFIKSLIF